MNTNKLEVMPINGTLCKLNLMNIAEFRPQLTSSDAAVVRRERL